VATVVVPFRGNDPKRRLEPISDEDRLRIAEAMLEDVLDAARAVGRVFVVALEKQALPADVDRVDDPHHGQGAAVRAALDAASAAGSPPPYLVVNADLPCVTARDLLALAGAIPEHGLALAPAADGTTNAIGLADENLFTPLYGPGSAERYAALGPSRVVEAPNLVDDVDTVHDLHRLASRLGQHTACVLASLRGEAAA
jgi:2-phospho-L-lactate guanylyltransferase